LLARAGARGTFSCTDPPNVGTCTVVPKHRLPGRERQVEEQVVAAHAEQRVRAQATLRYRSPSRPPFIALAALPREAQALALGRAPGNARFEAALHPVRQPALVVVGHGESSVTSAPR